MNRLLLKRRALTIMTSLLLLLWSGSMVDVMAEHHVPGRLDPYNNCQLCHGVDLQGCIARSCYTCHGRLWPGGDTPPLADAAGPYSGEVDAAVQFDGSASSDVDGIIASYSWDFGDGAVGTGARPRHTYTAVGLYTVLLTVTDDNGHTNSASTTADITASTANLPPLAVVGGPYTAETGETVQFDGSNSMDMDGTIVTYSWDFGDGNAGNGATPTHVYDNVGIFTVQLTVTDDGGASNSAQTTVTVLPGTNSPPVVDLGGPYSAAAGEELQFDASNTTDPDGDTLIFLWDFGDGSVPPLPSQSPLAKHTYNEPGTYTVQLAVTDGSPTPVIGTVQVEITDGDTDPDPPGLGDSWAVRVPLQQLEFVVSFQPFYGYLWVQATYPDGSTSLGVGFELSGMVLWIDASGAVYVGNVDAAAGTMMGIVLDTNNGSSIWMAERL